MGPRHDVRIKAAEGARDPWRVAVGDARRTSLVVGSVLGQGRSLRLRVRRPVDVVLARN